MVLVGGFNHLEKYEFVNGKDDIPYIYMYIYEMENHKFMFETTKQINMVYIMYIPLIYIAAMLSNMLNSVNPHLCSVFVSLW